MYDLINFFLLPNTLLECYFFSLITFHDHRVLNSRLTMSYYSSLHRRQLCYRHHVLLLIQFHNQLFIIASNFINFVSHYSSSSPSRSILPFLIITSSNFVIIITSIHHCIIPFNLLFTISSSPYRIQFCRVHFIISIIIIGSKIKIRKSE